MLARNKPCYMHVGSTMVFRWACPGSLKALDHDISTKNRPCAHARRDVTYMAIEHYVIRHKVCVLLHGLVFAKRHPALTLHIGARKSSTVSSLFTACWPECAMLGPASFRPIHLEPQQITFCSKFSNNLALYCDPMPLKSCLRHVYPHTISDTRSLPLFWHSFSVGGGSLGTSEPGDQRKLIGLHTNH